MGENELSQQRDLFLRQVGDICVCFSNLEFMVGDLLGNMIDVGGGSIVGGFVVDGFNISKTLTMLRKIARFRYAHNEEFLGSIEDLCQKIDRVREQRNMFIHGMWNFNEDHLSNHQIGVLSGKWKHVKSESRWERMKEVTYTHQELSSLAREISSLSKQAMSLRNGLKPEMMMPYCWQKKGKTDEA